jgi:shikimate dehydrogenase
MASSKAPLDGFPLRRRSFRAAGGKGMNVTAPFNAPGVRARRRTFLTRARLAGASNALKFDGEPNFRRRISTASAWSGHHAHNLGLSGARSSRAGARPQGARRAASCSRCLAESRRCWPSRIARPGKRKRLRQLFAGVGTLEAGGLDDFVGYGVRHRHQRDVGQSAGRKRPPSRRRRSAKAGCVRNGLRQGTDAFSRARAGSGAGRLADGVGMLVEQAAEGFEWWRGVRPDTRGVIERLAVPFTTES